MAIYAFTRWRDGEVRHFSVTRHDPTDPDADVVHADVPPEVAAEARERTASGEGAGVIGGEWWYAGYHYPLRDAALLLLRTRGRTRDAILAHKNRAVAEVEKAAADMLALLPPDATDMRANDLLDMEMG